MNQIVSNYSLVKAIEKSDGKPLGDSGAPKEIIFHISENNLQNVKVLDIGFGAGKLGYLVKENPNTSHWEVDGVDGWKANCHNADLISKRYYRNIWHCLAQDLSAEHLKSYDIICLLDVIEHLNAQTARSLVAFLFENLGEKSALFLSTPLWFYPQESVQAGDLEEHLIGIPASSMMAMQPRMYAVNHPLIGGFVFGKESAVYAEFFQPSENKDFSYEMGLNILKRIGMEYKPGILFKLNPTN
jgi:2-polyprenyl-3-methyl-5-hydroxy-6-metoxy-1,4-benzoquinol methylase